MVNKFTKKKKTTKTQRPPTTTITPTSFIVHWSKLPIKGLHDLHRSCSDGTLADAALQHAVRPVPSGTQSPLRRSFSALCCSKILVWAFIFVAVVSKGNYLFVWLPRKIVGIKRNEKMKISILINRASVSSSASVKIPPLFLIIRFNSQISYFYIWNTLICMQNQSIE